MTEENKTELALQKYTGTEVFDQKGLDKILQQVREKALAEPQDLTTKAGRDHIASTAYKVSKSKTFLQKLADDHVAELKAKIDPVMADKKRIGLEMDALRDEVRKPLTDWETAEKTRVDMITRSLEAVKNAHSLPFGVTSAEVEKIIAKLEAPTTLRWDEFQEQYEVAKEFSLQRLRAQLPFVQKAEQDAKDLAEAKAKLAETEVKPAESVAETKTETSTISDEEKAIEHKRKINRAAVEFITAAGEITNDQAEKIVIAIARKQVPNVSITY